MTADGAGSCRAVWRSPTPQLPVLAAVGLPRRPLEGSTTPRGGLLGGRRPPTPSGCPAQPTPHQPAPPPSPSPRARGPPWWYGPDASRRQSWAWRWPPGMWPGDRSAMSSANPSSPHRRKPLPQFLFRHGSGVRRHGDRVTLTDDYAMIVHGRSDATPNCGRVRMDSSDIFHAVETVSDVTASPVVGVKRFDGGGANDRCPRCQFAVRWRCDFTGTQTSSPRVAGRPTWIGA